jgi:EAL domain-containing protein (putative c-di-GMP-specific phosphodiesterase class I)
LSGNIVLDVIAALGDSAQLQQLRQEGCTEVQGYLFSEPRPANELAALLKRHAAAAKAVA